MGQIFWKLYQRPDKILFRNSGSIYAIHFKDIIERSPWFLKKNWWISNSAWGFNHPSLRTLNLYNFQSTYWWWNMVQKEGNFKGILQSISNRRSSRPRLEQGNSKYMAQGGMEKLPTCVPKIHNMWR